VNTRTTRAAALGQDDATVDIVGASMIPTNVDIASPVRVDSALYELWMDGGDVSGLIIRDGRQAIEGHTDRGVLVRVFRTVPDAGATQSFPVTDAALAEYLETNQVIDASYPPLREAALGAIRDAGQDPWAAATRIERLVFDTIEDKGLGTTFASAREAFDRRSGDCSEHAVLAASMMRSVGIPSKVVAGIAHFRGRFAYHMWIEVWAGGAWYALDPTTGEGSVDATHLKLAESGVPGGRVADLSIGVLRALNRLHVKVVEYTADGATVRP
jgi:transglutaminase-like putative cysteine protease